MQVFHKSEHLTRVNARPQKINVSPNNAYKATRNPINDIFRFPAVKAQK